MARSFKIQGYNYTGYGTDVYGTGISKQQLAEIKETGANAIAIIPEYYQKTLQSNTLAPTNITPDDDDLIAGIKAAQAKGLNVLLNPHMDTEDGQWRAYLDPTDPQKWFESYKAMEVHYAKIAAQPGVKSYSVGCKLDVIGVDGYFSLAVKDDNPTVKELEYAWTHPSASNSINKGLDGKSPVDY